MTDDLVKRLRAYEGKGFETAACYNGTRSEAADRIEELEAKLAEQIEWVKCLADDLIAAEGREARLKDKLAEAVEVLNALDATLDRNGWHVDSLAREEILATLANIKSQGDEFATQKGEQSYGI